MGWQTKSIIVCYGIFWSGQYRFLNFFYQLGVGGGITQEQEPSWAPDSEEPNYRYPWVYLFVEGRGFYVEGEGTMSKVEGNIFFPIFFFLEKVIIDAINVIKTNKKNLKNKWRVNIF